ncbi:MAG: FapA family protein, partial [Clostridiales bacterium]|nr:FapA family protein [Clostridiales bacterium]
KQREDGSVDYRELGLIKNVYEGEVLCNIVLPKAGLDGTNVFGGAIPAKQGKPAAVEPGNNVVITDDKTELRAGTDGCVYFKGGKVYIEEAYSVKSDVCLKTGNIQFNGSVHIAESVRQGFKVTAQKDIYVKGLVEGAELSAGGNIAIVGGITGMNTAKIEAGGDITVKFIENAHVECGGNITCDIILMSDVKAEKSIVMKGERAAIIGGRVLAGETITAKALGSNKHPKQEVSVRRNWNVEGDNAEKEQMKDREKKAALKKKLAAAEKMVEEYSARIKAENALGPKKSIAAMKECMVKKSEFAAVAASLKNMIENYIEHDFVSSISCTGFVYPGVRIRIDHCQMDVTTPLQNQKFYVSEGEIVAGTVLPGERNA